MSQDQDSPIVLQVKVWFGPYAGRRCKEFLQSHGFNLGTCDRSQLVWLLPVPHHTVSCYEAICILYMMEVHAFGGVHESYEEGTIHCVCSRYKDDGIPCYLA